MLNEIATLKLNKVVNRIRNNYSAELYFDEQLVIDIVDSSNESGSGARAIQATIENNLLPKISHEILDSILTGKTLSEISVKKVEEKLVVSIS